MSGHYDSNVLMFSIVRNRQVDTGAINTNATKDPAAGIPDFQSVPASASELISHENWKRKIDIVQNGPKCYKSLSSLFEGVL